ncbi:beta-N-acetylhexosaminidase [Candidatus Arthromitus sp. SFB-rat-Yit]|uniref:beta-N-acetylhexosaminidase n=1 Tax=Candidatus Arthromitus sp. SFB-rat-Yit TaxID=1041504 RepID=UPI000315A3D4|nr:beta-N-acetylhexosaminidase [Candidatus Arthromitus sp. SFB-rat-Yit]
MIFLSLFTINSCSYNRMMEEDLIQVKVNKPDEILEKINSMNLDEKIGQLFIVGFDGESNLTQEDILLINDYKVSGFIFFRRNIQSSDQVVKLINEIKTINKNGSNIPMFLSLDQEGGTVTRLPNEIIKFKSARDIGKINNEQYAYDTARVMGELVHSLGFNMNFAPVLDVYTNPENTVIGSRAFSSDKEIVSKLAVATMKGLKDSGVIAVGKHYPGHGDTKEDSHYELPIVNHDYERVKDIELYPFKMAIENGIDSILVSHLLYKNIDSENIATLSKVFLDDILMRELRFRGIVITDDMIMNGLTKNNSITEACLKALQAGVDILLIGSGYQNIVDSINFIKNAVLNGEISEFEIEKKVYSVLKMKQKYNVNNDNVSKINVDEFNDKIRNLSY